ncbi:holo-ACP synthase [Fimbriimonas ginsengisoli]|uniref:Holo-[acyl-carrier-protein] synthase n=1 Tax=Fimbriimonas ginsengisoli Gsoil 348 TaxID=661478 RepID=A0A068NNA9_FIMGI|nr:holo-ACP synthase [Fimbriimonas ginsengisoli]AIE84887.1 4'-phosphopantetheinyl transferase [Fimbriimonas ginsengisoli Gsoil 348]
MIVGLGIDLVEIERIRRAMKNPRFVYRILTDSERALCTTPARVAGRWAAKEAVYKAVGLPLCWHDIEILQDHLGAPRVQIHSHQYDGKRLRLQVSITHERSHAAAVATLERVVMQVPTVS